MVTTEDEEILRVLDLISKQQTDDFERLLSSVNVVPKKKIVGLNRENSRKQGVRLSLREAKQ